MIRTNSKGIDNAKKLTRIHVHTLAYQTIMVEKGSEWQRPKAAAAKASLIANRHACGRSSIDVHKARLIMDESFSLSMTPGSKRMNLVDKNPVTCWDEKIKLSENEINDVHICVAPVLVCTDVKQTAGCGDNISSAGLVLQI